MSHRRNILIVDDSRAWREMLSEILLALDPFIIHKAEDVASAKVLLQKQTYALIIADLHMPGGDGLSLARWMRHSTNAATRHSPFIIMSSDASTNDVMKSKCCGADYFIAKPIKIPALAAAIVQLCSRERQNLKSPPCADDVSACSFSQMKLSRTEMNARLQNLIVHAKSIDKASA